MWPWPHPALLAMADPYDPVANAPYRVHDMTLYKGHYYLYFGVSPVSSFSARGGLDGPLP